MVKDKQWVEAAWDNFEEALSLGNIPFCQDIISDTKDAGYIFHANRMQEKLKDFK